MTSYQPVNTLQYYTSPVHLERPNYSASSFVPRGREVWQPHPVFTPQYNSVAPLHSILPSPNLLNQFQSPPPNIIPSFILKECEGNEFRTNGIDQRV